MVPKILLLSFSVLSIILYSVSYTKSEPLPIYRKYAVNDYDETYIFGLSDDDKRSFHHHTTEREKRRTTSAVKGHPRSLPTKSTTEDDGNISALQMTTTSVYDITGETTAKPEERSTITAYKYLGCHDSWINVNQTGVTLSYDDTNTPEECVTKCKNERYQLAFLKDYLCYCSHTSDFDLIRVPDIYCDIPCEATRKPESDVTERRYCGGNYVFSVYCSEDGIVDCSSYVKPFHPLDIYRPTQRPPAADPDYTENPEDDESDHHPNSIPYISCSNCTTGSCRRTSYSPEFDYMPKMTPEVCIEYCRRPVGYLRDNQFQTRNSTKFAILLWDKYMPPPFVPPLPICACRDNVTNFKGEKEVDSVYCNAPCPGNPSKTCGGSNQVTIYCVDLEYCADEDSTTVTMPDIHTTTDISTTYNGDDNGSSTTIIPTEGPSTPRDDQTTATTTTTTAECLITTAGCPTPTDESPTTTESHTTTAESPTTTSESPATTTEDPTTTTEDPTTTTEDPTTTTEDPTTTTEDPTTTENPTTTEGATSTTEDPTSTTVFQDSTTTELVTTKPTTTSPPSTVKTTVPISRCDFKCEKTDSRGTTWEGCPGTLVQKPCTPHPTSSAMAEWRCSLSGEFSTSHPDYSNCKTEWVEKLDEALDKIDDLDHAETFLDIVTEHCNGAQGSPELKYFGHEIGTIVKVVKKVVDIAGDHSSSPQEYKRIAEQVMNITEALFFFDDPWKELDHLSKSNASNQIINVIEEAVFSLTSKVKLDEIYSTNIGGPKAYISVTAAAFPKKKSNNESLTYLATDGSFMKLPANWQHVVKGEQIHITYMFLDSKLVRRTMPGQYRLIGDSEDNEPDGKLVNGKLISCSIGDSENPARIYQPIKFEGKGVEMTFYHDVEAWGKEKREIKRKLHKGEEAKAVSGSAQCAFWDTNGLKWSTDGCKVIAGDRYSTTCECSHLTSFAILMDTHKYVGKDFWLEVLTLCICPLSIICLFISIVVFSTVRSIQNPRTIITKHLSICLLIGTTLVLLVIDRNYFNMSDGVCIASGIISHYVFLCAFLWMAIEGIHLYKMVVHVFDSANDYTKLYAMIAYGVPILIVAITTSIGYLRGHRPYGGDVYCWLDGSYIWSFLVPVALIIAGNLIVLFITLKTAYQLQHTTNIMQSRVRDYRTWLRGCFSVTVLLGVTWMFGFFILTENVIAGVVAAYFFTLLNGSQGIFLFIFHCVMNEKVRAVAERTLPLPSWLTSSSIGPSQSFMGKTTASHMRSFDSGASKSVDFPYRVSAISCRPDGLDGLGGTRVVRRGSISMRRNESSASMSSGIESRRGSDTGSTTDGSRNMLVEHKKAQKMASTC